MVMRMIMRMMGGGKREKVSWFDIPFLFSFLMPLVAFWFSFLILILMCWLVWYIYIDIDIDIPYISKLILILILIPLARPEQYLLLLRYITLCDSLLLRTSIRRCCVYCTKENSLKAWLIPTFSDDFSSLFSFVYTYISIQKEKKNTKPSRRLYRGG